MSTISTSRSVTARPCGELVVTRSLYGPGSTAGTRKRRTALPAASVVPLASWRGAAFLSALPSDTSASSTAALASGSLRVSVRAPETAT